MTKNYLLSVLVLMCVSLATSSYAQDVFKTKKLTLDEVEKKTLSKYLKHYEAGELATTTLTQKAKAKRTDLFLRLQTEAFDWKIVLSENDLRASGFKVVAQQEGGPEELTVGENVTYKGKLSDDPDSEVRLTLSGDFFEGYVRQGNQLVFIRPLSRFLPAGKLQSKDKLIFFKDTDVIDVSQIAACGVNDVEQLMEARKSTPPGGRTTSPCRIIEIATEIDNEGMQYANIAGGGGYVQLSGNAIVNHMMSLLNQAEGVYTSTFDIRFVITHMNLWWANDPYSSTQASMSNLLINFKDYWQANFTHVKRDLAYFFTGRRNFTDAYGSAFASIVCKNASLSYAISSMDAGWSPQPETTLAHEIGHTIGATHPSSSSASCTPSATIMCVGNSNRILAFSGDSQNQINTYLNANSSCLTTVASLSITGPDVMCPGGTNGTAHFCVLVPTGAGSGCRTDVTWSATTGLSMTSSGYAVAQSGYNGPVTVTATMPGECPNGNYTSTKTVYVGNPGVSISGNSSICVNQSGSFTALAGSPGTSYSWSVPYGSGSVSLSPSGNYCTVYPSVTGGFVLQVVATNSCGSSTSNITVYVRDCSGGYGYALAPNPASDQVLVKANGTSSDEPGVDKIHEVKITDKFGNAKKHITNIGGKDEYNVDLKGLRADLYFIRIFNGKEWKTQKLVVE